MKCSEARTFAVRSHVPKPRARQGGYSRELRTMFFGSPRISNTSNTLNSLRRRHTGVKVRVCTPSLKCRMVKGGASHLKKAAIYRCFPKELGYAGSLI